MKALLVGEFSEELNKVNSILADKYTVQISTMESEALSGMIKVVKPHLLVVHLGEGKKLEEDMIACLKDYAGAIPIVLLSSPETYAEMEEALAGLKINPSFTPHNAENVLEVCQSVVASIKRTILIVDDSPVVLRNLKEVLEERYEVLLATSGAMAIDRVKQYQLDAVLLDYEMPIMDGKEAFSRIKELPEGQDIPVIFLTGVTDTDRIVDVLKQKPAGYVLKPPDRVKIIETLESVMI